MRFSRRPFGISANLSAIFGGLLGWLKARRSAFPAALAQYREFAHFSNDIVLLMDEKGIVVEANDRAVEAYGHDYRNLIGQPIAALRSSERDWLVDWGAVARDGNHMFEVGHRRADGSIFQVEVSSRAIKIEGRRYVQSVIRDISQRKAAEVQIRRLKDVYAALSQTNQCIVRAVDRDELFQTVCDIAIEFGHFSLAWVGLVDPESGDLVPAARAGRAVTFLDGIKVSTRADSPVGQGPAARAIRSGLAQVITDFDFSEGTNPWRDGALRFGLRSAGGFPLRLKGASVGALTLYSDDPDFFSEDLCNLLSEMAMDISFALDRLEMEEDRRVLRQDLALSNAWLRGVVDGTGDMVAAWDRDLRVVLFNQAYAHACRRRFGVAIRKGLSLEDALAGSQELGMFATSWRRTLEGQSFTEDYCFGEEPNRVWVEAKYNPLLDPDGRVIGGFHLIRDISERMRTQEKLHRLSIVVEQSPMAVLITDTEGRIEYVNAAFCASSGYSPEEVLGIGPNILKGGHTPEGEYKILWQTIKSGRPWTGTFHNKRKNGTYFWEEGVIAPLHDSEGRITHFVGIKQDVTARYNAEARLAFLAHHDALTHLPNRVLGKERMQWAMARADRSLRKAVLLFLDLDNFKRINDSLGHAIGDALLRAVADRLLECVRTTDVVSRHGGDEFFIGLSEIEDRAAAAEVAHKILDHMAASFEIDGHELAVSMSIGIAVYPDDAGNFENLIKCADTAMYYAKEVGRNTYSFFTDQMNYDDDEYLGIRNSIRKALEKGEFSLHYQPQIDLTSGCVVGAEALIRWNHPTQGLIPPARFIPIAEESGMIVPIGEWVLEEACRQAAAWQAMGLPKIVVAVNMSGVQFRRGDLSASVERALARSSLDPACLELELTETILIKDTANVLKAVARLKAHGIKLSIDDFGTGYSSLAYLRQFAVDKVKIDQSFTRDITSDANDEAIVQAIVQMAHNLGLVAIAEGVENLETLELLRQHGCDEAQGYHFAKPMPAEEFMAYLARA